jgi:hypothetical protein
MLERILFPIMSKFAQLELIRIEQDETPWLKVPTPTHTSSAQLCENCAALDFRVLMSRPFTHYRYPKTS